MDTFYKSKWLGLNSYQESDSTQFFGRDGEVSRLVGAIDENGLCTVFGPSGAGKTSLLLAGVFPRLRRNDSLPVYLRFDHEKDAASYVSQVIETIADAVRKAGFAIRAEAPSVLPEENETLWEWFHRHLILDDCFNPIRPVLVIDQFEEIFTKGLERRGETEVRAFFTELTDLCTNNIPQSVVRTVEDGQGDLGFDHEECNWRLVVSLREDFLPRLEEISHDHPVFRKMRHPVGFFNREQALQSILGTGGDLVDEKVANAIVDFVGSSTSGSVGLVGPALLSLFCSRLDITRQQNGQDRITHELLAASEKDILASFYVETMGKVSAKTMSLLEDHLLTAGGYRSSWAVEDAKLEGVRQSEIDALINARLLHVDHRGGVSWLEFSHDILTAEARSSRANRRLLREKARARRMAGLLVSLVVLLGASSLAIWHFFYREYAPCYLKTVKVFGRFQGLGEPLSEVDQRQASVYFKLHRRGRYSFHPHADFGHWFEKSLVYRMEALDGRGRLTTQHGMGTYLWNGEEVSGRGIGMIRDTPERGGVVAQTQSSDEMKKVCAWEFGYGHDGRPLHEFGVDRDGKLVWSCTYAPCVDGDQWRSNTVVHFVDARGFPLQQRSDNAEYVEITYDAETGFERRFVYYDASRKITKGKDGAECHEQHLNDRGLCTRLASMAWSKADGRFTNIIDVAGNTGMWTEFLSNDMVAVSHSYGLEGEPHPTARGVLIHLQTYDRLNRIVRQQLLGTNGVECAYDESGWSRIENSYYENGVTKRTDIYAPPGCGGIWGATNVHHVVTTFDMQGNVLSQSYLGTNGLAVADNVNVHCVRFQYGMIAGKSCQTSEWYLNERNLEVANANGVARQDNAYNSNGLLTRIDLYAPKGCGGIWNYTNVHHVVRLYDTQGNVTNECFYGTDEGSAVGNNNVHCTCRKYETIAGKNCKVAEWYLDENDREAVDKNGVAQTETEYDAYGVRTRIDLYAPKGRGGIWDYTNVHHVVRLYDTQGNEVEQSFYGLGDVPTVGNFDVHRIGKSYATVAGESREVAEWYLDGNSEPTTNWIGVTRGAVDYDSQGRMVQLMGFAPKGRGGIMGYEAAHQFVSKFNAGGDLIERSFFDESGNPVQGENNAHCTHWKYKMIAGESRQVAEWYVDEWGREVANKNGIARTVTEYDADGKKTRIDYYAPKGCGGIWNYEKVHHVIRLYDAQGNETNRCFYGTGEEPVAGNDNVHRISREYNNRNEQVGISYFDERMKPIQIVSVVYAAEVVDGAFARAAGVLPGDVFCEFGTYRLRGDGDFSAVASSIQEFAQKEKRLIVARKVGDGYRIISFKLPVGKMGIRICDKQVAGHEFEKIQKAYRMYMVSKKAVDSMESAEQNRKVD